MEKKVGFPHPVSLLFSKTATFHSWSLSLPRSHLKFNSHANSSSLYNPAGIYKHCKSIHLLVLEYNGPILWNETDERFKILTPYSFQRQLSLHFIYFYWVFLLIAIFWYFCYFSFFFTNIFFIVHTCLRVICSVIYFLVCLKCKMPLF